MPMAPSTFTFDDPSLPASPVDNSRSPLFKWLYSFSPSMQLFCASSLASFPPCDRPFTPSWSSSKGLSMSLSPVLHPTCPLDSSVGLECKAMPLDPAIYGGLTLPPSDLGLGLGGMEGMDMGAGAEYQYLMSTGSWDGLIPSL
ncbi:hypothetical protein B0H14DRAFT_3452919 [Mycena olivaceomarginata]|nr:hypothetical protein B0H14DRAFT_3452919 [Mycena olivaceomarginata]